LSLVAAIARRSAAAARVRLSRHRAAVLGTAMEYQIAEVVDSEYDVVAKVSKTALARLGK